MPALKRFTLFFWDDPARYDLLRGVEWPAELTHLTVDTDADLDGVEIPASVSVSRVTGVW